MLTPHGSTFELFLPILLYLFIREEVKAFTNNMYESINCQFMLKIAYLIRLNWK